MSAEEDEQQRRWLDRLPGMVEAIRAEWQLELGPRYETGLRHSWVAPARTAEGEELALKVGWRHLEAEHEAEALALWDGDGAVRCLAARRFEDTVALLLERCQPGVALNHVLPEAEQDLVIAALLRRLWAHQPAGGSAFRSLAMMCEHWANGLERKLDAAHPDVDLALAREALTLLRELPASAERSVLLCTDLHGENVLSAQREPWLVIDPKPFLGDPAFDPVQHMLNCEERLAEDPRAMARGMAELLDLDPERVSLWLFARCAQEALRDPSMREPARQLAP